MFKCALGCILLYLYNSYIFRSKKIPFVQPNPLTKLYRKDSIRFRRLLLPYRTFLLRNTIFLKFSTQNILLLFVVFITNTSAYLNCKGRKFIVFLFTLAIDSRQLHHCHLDVLFITASLCRHVLRIMSLVKHLRLIFH